MSKAREALAEVRARVEKIAVINEWYRLQVLDVIDAVLATPEPEAAPAAQAEPVGYIVGGGHFCHSEQDAKSCAWLFSPTKGLSLSIRPVYAHPPSFKSVQAGSKESNFGGDWVDDGC